MPGCAAKSSWVIFEGATHMDFYDVPKYVDRAVAEAAPFFEKHLAARG